MEEWWFTLREHPGDHGLYVRETFVDDTRPIKYVIWHPTGLDARIYRASFGAARIGTSLVPTAGPDLTFRFAEMPDAAEVIAIDQHAHPIKTEEAIPLPEIKEQYRDTIYPEWRQGKWMYCILVQGQENWFPLLPEHLMQPVGEDDG